MSQTRGEWIPWRDGSLMFMGSSEGRYLGVHGDTRYPPGSSTQPTSPGPQTPSSGQDRLPLDIPSSGNVQEIRPIPRMGSRWSSSSDPLELPRPGQVNPYQPYGDHRPQQLQPPHFGSSPPIMPRDLRDLVSSPTQHRTMGYHSRPSTAGDDSDRPYTPTPTQQEVRRRIGSIPGFLYANERSVVDDENATVQTLLGIERLVIARRNLARRSEAGRDRERR